MPKSSWMSQVDTGELVDEAGKGTIDASLSNRITVRLRKSPDRLSGNLNDETRARRSKKRFGTKPAFFALGLRRADPLFRHYYSRALQPSRKRQANAGFLRS
ncbi:hypothetical protein [Mesorhizobium sp. M7A.F.Ca.CA.002.15.1.1]|uniref:hypothetical protein n=1 Tax=Mesorhizobium sp. M7A.F.Ca.CA.002.15.1.1 TaxID=2496717 RepID=UPI0013E333B3|nr:hypothetical protein [Mesorhizobium sp. M7A.F.Ca.CA.002.15.1.1]